MNKKIYHSKIISRELQLYKNRSAFGEWWFRATNKIVPIFLHHFARPETCYKTSFLMPQKNFMKYKRPSKHFVWESEDRLVDWKHYLTCKVNKDVESNIHLNFLRKILNKNKCFFLQESNAISWGNKYMQHVS